MDQQTATTPDDRFRFIIAGDPAPQGSTRAFVVAGRAQTTNTTTPKATAWRDAIVEAVRRDWDGREPLDGPVALTVEFRHRMPKSARAYDRERGWRWRDRQPDWDKLERTVGDALQAAGVLRNDGQVAKSVCTTIDVWDGWIGADLTIWSLREDWDLR